MREDREIDAKVDAEVEEIQRWKIAYLINDITLSGYDMHLLKRTIGIIFEE